MAKEKAKRDQTKQVTEELELTKLQAAKEIEKLKNEVLEYKLKLSDSNTKINNAKKALG